jgi:ABC transport system ATP-binding/permease protein
VLSGGERARLILARELAKPSNFLVLDEPTNDLDLETLDLLQEMLGDYQGTILLVSHDRDFLDRVATSILMFEGDGKWTEYAGGYSDMVAQRGAGVNARDVKVAVSERIVSPGQPPKMPSKRKLSFKDKHALETLPGKMAALHAEITTLETKLADTELYSRDPKAFEKTMKRHEKVKAEIAHAEEHWLELEMLREELEVN